MARRPPQIISRRAAVAGLAATAAAYSPAVAETIQSGAATENGVGPVFSASGLDAERYGAAKGYPIADPTLARQPGEPHELKYRGAPTATSMKSFRRGGSSALLRRGFSNARKRTSAIGIGAGDRRWRNIYRAIL